MNRALATVLVCTLGLAYACGGGPGTAVHPYPPREPGAPLFGVTVDSVSDISSVIAAEATLPRRATTRVVFDVHEPASSYRAAVSTLHVSSFVMGELLDSSDEATIGRAAFETRVRSYLSTLGTAVDVWEIGNEVNGSWTGAYPEVAAKLVDAYRTVAAAGRRTALTVYSNDFGPDNCGDGPAELTPVEFTQRYVPTSVRDGLDYVFLSYYPAHCGGIEPSPSALREHLQRLHDLYPHALLGFGEVGLPDPVTPPLVPEAAQVMTWAYGLDPGLSYYVGGYFWWYAREDCFTGARLLLPDLRAAFVAEAGALAKAYG